MKLRVVYSFHDKDDFTKVYGVGEILDFEDARAKDVVSRGLCEVIEEKEEPKADKPSEAPKRRTKKA